MILSNFKKTSTNNLILVFVIGMTIVSLFSSCINWSYTVEHNQLRTIEDYED